MDGHPHVGFDVQPRRLGTFAIMWLFMQKLWDKLSNFHLNFIWWWMVGNTRAWQTRSAFLIPKTLDPDHFITESMLSMV